MLELLQRFPIETNLLIYHELTPLASSCRNGLKTSKIKSLEPLTIRESHRNIFTSELYTNKNYIFIDISLALLGLYLNLRNRRREVQSDVDK